MFCPPCCADIFLEFGLRSIVADVWEANIAPNSAWFCNVHGQPHLRGGPWIHPAVSFHRYRVRILATFHERAQPQTASIARSNQPGYDGLLYQLQSAMAHHTKPLRLAICSALASSPCSGTARKRFLQSFPRFRFLFDAVRVNIYHASNLQMVEQTACFQPTFLRSSVNVNMVFSDPTKTHMDRFFVRSTTNTPKS